MVCPAPVRTPGCAATRWSPALTDLRVDGSWVSHGLSLCLERGGGVSAGLLHFPAGNAVLPRKFIVLQQVVLRSP